GGVGAAGLVAVHVDGAAAGLGHRHHRVAPALEAVGVDALVDQPVAVVVLVVALLVAGGGHVGGGAAARGVGVQAHDRAAPLADAHAGGAGLAEVGVAVEVDRAVAVAVLAVAHLLDQRQVAVAVELDAGDAGIVALPTISAAAHHRHVL